MGFNSAFKGLKKQLPKNSPYKKIDRSIFVGRYFSLDLCR